MLSCFPINLFRKVCNPLVVTLALACPVSALAVNAYVPSATGDSGGVSVIDTSSDTIAASIEMPSPIEAAVSPDGTLAYITNCDFEGDNSIEVINTSNNEVIATIPLSLPAITVASYLALSPDGGTLYVSYVPWDGLPDGPVGLLLIDTASDTVVGNYPAISAPTMEGPGNIAITPDGSQIYVPIPDLYQISAVDTDSGFVTTITADDILPLYVAVAPNGTKAYSSANHTGDYFAPDVLIIDTASNTIEGSIDLDSPDYEALAITVTPDGTKAYVSESNDAESGLVKAIDLSSESVIASITIPDGGFGIAATPDSAKVYTPEWDGNLVSVISTASNTLLTTVSVPLYPSAVAIQPVGGPSPPTQNAELLGPKDCNCVGSTGASSAGEPIDIASGNMAYEVTDYKAAGQNPLSFKRYYNSRGNAPGIVTLAGTIGTNWRSNFDRFIQINSSSQVTVERSTGQQFIFNLVGSTWTPNADVDITLTQSGSAWTLTDHNDTVESYTTTGSGSSALLSAIQSRNGYTQTLHRNGSNQLTSVTDSYSRSLNFTYNGNGTIATVATPDSTTLTYGYNTVTGGIQLTSISYSTTPASSQTYSYTQSGLPFALTGITDENGNSYATWTYDAYGRGLTSQLGSGANFTQMSYTSAQTVVANAFDLQDTYSFTTAQNIPKITTISRAATATTVSATESFGFDTNGYVNSRKDRNGNTTTLVNNSHGDPTTITEAVSSPVQRTTSIVYDTTCVHQPHSVATTGVTASYTYDSHCDPLTKTLTDTTTQSIPYSTNGQTHVWTYTWNNFLLASVETPNLKTTHYHYSGSGALTEITNPLSQSTNITSYTGGGYPLTITNPNSVLTTLTWNARQRLTSSAITTTGGVLTTTYTLDPVGELTELTLPDDSFLSYIYDHAHRLTDVTDADNNEIEYTLDALGDKTQIDTYNSSDTLVRQHSATFDALGRMLTDVGGEGQTTSYSYDPNGNNLTITDPLLNETIRTFDALNRLSTSTDANHGVTQFAYDAHDRILTAEDTDSNTTSYVYDGFGNPIQQASPDSNTSVYYFDPDNNQTQKVDALAIVTNNTYDSLDRVLTTQYPAESSLNVAYTYDQTGSGYGFGVGHLTSLTDAAGSLTRSYDERGNMLTNDRTSGSTNLNTAYTYDPASRIASVTYPSGSVVTNVYDTAGYLHQVKAKPTGVPITTTLATLTHLPFGPINSNSYGNDVSESWTFDQDYRSTNITDTVSSTTLQNLTYGYDADNNIKTITDAVNVANSQTLGYDVLNRINSAVSGSGGYGSLAWTYDNNGNVKTHKVGSATTTYTYTGGTNRLASIASGGIPKTVSTDANGNITSIPPANSSASATFSYGNDNRLASVSGSPVAASFVYDAFGQRFSKTDSGSASTLYSYLPNHRLIEENNNGTVADYIYADGRPISVLKITSGSLPVTSYILADRLGTPQLATSSSHSTVWSTTYQPYGTTGTITGAITQNLRLPGQNWDNETGFYYNIQRDYMPNIGRYLETDTIGLLGGMNSYRYAVNNPVKYQDRRGMQQEEEEGAEGPGLDEIQDYLDEVGREREAAQQDTEATPETAEPVQDAFIPGQCPQRPLVRMHSENTLTTGSDAYSYNYWLQQTTQDIIDSLQMSSAEPLIVDDNGLVWQGNMRVYILQERGVDVDNLPRTSK